MPSSVPFPQRQLSIIARIGWLLLLALMLLAAPASSTDIIDNTCTFKVDGKLFTLTYLNQNKPGSPGYYQVGYNDQTDVFFNFCEPFVPASCAGTTLPSAYSYVAIAKSFDSELGCLPYSSDSKTSYFTPDYIN